MGFTTPARRSAKVAGMGCDHEGLWDYRVLDNGLAVRYCSGCGLSYLLVQDGHGAFLLVEVPEHGPEKWEDASLFEAEDEQDKQEEKEEQGEAAADEAAADAEEDAEEDVEATP